MGTCISLARNGTPFTEFDIIDMHGHLGSFDFATPDSSPDSIVADMDRIGVQSILLSSMHCMSPDYVWGNDEVLRAMEAFPGRILGYVSIFPDDAARATDEMERRVAQGFSGLKLHSAVGFGYDDPVWRAVIAIADRHRLPVLLHTWGGEAEFATVRALSAEFTQCAFLLAHAGCCNADGYHAMGKDIANVYLDPTLSRAPRGSLRAMVDAVGVEKVVFGSDSSFISMAHQFGKLFACGLTDPEIKTILSDNPKRLLARRIA